MPKQNKFQIINESEILYENAKSLGIDLLKIYNDANKRLSERIVEEFGSNKSYTLLVGMAGNGTDGIILANHLYEQGVKSIKLYLIGRANNIESPVGKKVWDYIFPITKKSKNIIFQQDCFAEDIEQDEVVIEALVGTGFEGNKLTKRYKDIVDRFSHFNSIKIALDKPCPHYVPDKVYSFHYPKTNNAEVINSEYPEELENYAGPGEKKVLAKPHKHSHKSKNGNVLIISNKKIDNKVFEDYSVNLTLFDFNSDKKDFISYKDLEKNINTSDTVLVGNLEDNLVTKSTINNILNTYNKTFVITGNSIDIIDLENLKNKKVVLVLSNNQFKILFNDNKSEILIGKLRGLAVEKQIDIVSLSSRIFLINKTGDTKIVVNKNGVDEESITNLACKIAAYSTLNDLWLSVRAGVV